MYIRNYLYVGTHSSSACHLTHCSMSDKCTASGYSYIEISYSLYTHVGLLHSAISQSLSYVAPILNDR